MRGFKLFTLMVVVPLVAGCMQGPPDEMVWDHSHPFAEGISIGSTSKSLILQGDQNGTIALQMGIRSTVETVCAITWMAHGASRHVSPTSALMIMKSEGEPVFVATRGFWGGLVPFSVQAHLDDITVQSDPELQTWSVNTTRSFDLPALGATDIIVGATDLLLLPPQERHRGFPQALEGLTFRFSLECDSVATVTSLAQSEKAVVFDQGTFRGGAGMNAYDVFQATGGAVDSRIELDVTETSGILVLNIGGELLMNRLAAGHIRVMTPDNESEWVDRPSNFAECSLTETCPSTLFAHQAGPGIYAVEMTWAGVDRTGALTGMIAELEPVSTWSSE